MGLQERIDAAIAENERQKKAASDTSTQQAKKSQESIDSYIRSLNPVLSRLHVIDYLKEAERKARQILGDPPKEYRDLAKFKLCPSVSNRYHRIIEASACAGKSSSPFNVNVIEYHVFPSWTLDIYVSQNHEQQK